MNDLVTTIVTDVYGQNAMARGLASDLIEKIPGWDEGNDERDREHQIMLTCWNWFSGGSTAEAVARKIETVLKGIS